MTLADCWHPSLNDNISIIECLAEFISHGEPYIVAYR